MDTRTERRGLVGTCADDRPYLDALKLTDGDSAAEVVLTFSNASIAAAIQSISECPKATCTV